MIDPEAFAEYSPSQEELRQLYTGIQWALETNPRLHVETEISDVSGRTRIFRTTRIFGLDAVVAAPDDEIDEVVVGSRTCPSDKNDMDFVQVDFRSHANSRAQTVMSYQILQDLSFGPPDAREYVYNVGKFLPALAADNDPELGLDESAMADECSDADDVLAMFTDEFEEFMDNQVKAITPDDIAALKRTLKILND